MATGVKTSHHGAREENVALVISGGADRGMFAAGALSVLAKQERLRFRRVLGTSAGAENAAIFSSGIWTNTEVCTTERLCRLWHEDAGILSFASPSWRALRLEGLFSQKGIERLLEEGLSKANRVAFHPRREGNAPEAWRADMLLFITMTDLDGVHTPHGTRYERVVGFTSDVLDGGRQTLRQVAAASASIPLLFVPARVQLGSKTIRAVDGGAVNNTPYRWVTAPSLQHPSIHWWRAKPATIPCVDRVIVITTEPEREETSAFRGRGLIGHLVDVLINERLVRDLERADENAERLRELKQMASDGRISDATLGEIQVALELRELDLTVIRPAEELPGGGFFSKQTREKIIVSGEAAALCAMNGQP